MWRLDMPQEFSPVWLILDFCLQSFRGEHSTRNHSASAWASNRNRLSHRQLRTRVWVSGVDNIDSSKALGVQRPLLHCFHLLQELVAVACTENNTRDRGLVYKPAQAQRQERNTQVICNAPVTLHGFCCIHLETVSAYHMTQENFGGKTALELVGSLPTRPNN
jgi:hypothetical protein